MLCFFGVWNEVCTKSCAMFFAMQDCLCPEVGCVSFGRSCSQVRSVFCKMSGTSNRSIAAVAISFEVVFLPPSCKCFCDSAGFRKVFCFFGFDLCGDQFGWLRQLQQLQSFDAVIVLYPVPLHLHCFVLKNWRLQDFDEIFGHGQYRWH